MRSETDVRRGTDRAEQFAARVQGDWRRALVRAMTEPVNDQEQGEREVPAAPIEHLAARAVARAWPEVEELLRPIFETSALLPRDGQGSSRRTAAPPALPAIPPAAWLSAEEVAPVLHMTAHTLRRLARNGESPVVVPRIGGRWCFSRADLERLLAATT